MKYEAILSNFERKTKKIADQIINAYEKKLQCYPTLLSLMTFKIQQKEWANETARSIDLDYWRFHGWINPKSKFYISIRTNPVKKAFNRLIGAIMAKFML